MAAIITYYTTYDLATYYADTRRLVRLSQEEERHLFATLARSSPTSTTSPRPPLTEPSIVQARQRLVEGHLGLATRIAAELCPLHRPHLFPDLVQEANLALVLAASRFDPAGSGNFSAYGAAWIRGRIRLALSQTPLLKLDEATRRQARQDGTLDEVYARLRPISLDRLLEDDDPDSSLLDRLEIAAPLPRSSSSPVSPMTDTPATDEDEQQSAKRAQVDALLAYLSPRAQTILRLRYGLLEGDERPRGESEIAAELGLSRSMVHTTLLDAMQRLQALVRGQAHVVTRHGRACISLAGCRTPTLSPEREALLSQTAERIQAQGEPVSLSALMQATGLPKGVVTVFLRTHAQVFCLPSAAQDQQQARLARLEAAYQQLQVSGQQHITYRLLAQRAHVKKETAMTFLRLQRGQSAPRPVFHSSSPKAVRAQERQARLEAACHDLEAQGLPLSIDRLSRLAHVSKEATGAFLQARRKEEAHVAAAWASR